ncbi:unnamed protein product, partial [Discosporangium mesarthrocarpum]
SEGTADRAHACAKCLFFMSEEVSMAHIPVLFQQAFPTIAQVVGVDALPRNTRRKIFSCANVLFASMGTLVSVGGETEPLLLLQSAVPCWVGVVCSTLKALWPSPDPKTPWHEGNCGVELEAIRGVMMILTHTPGVVEVRSLAELMSVVWTLLLQGLDPYRERCLLGVPEEEDEGYASDGDRLGFEVLMVQLLELFCTIAGCHEPAVSSLLGGMGGGLETLLAVVIRYMQLTARDVSQWKQHPNDYVAEEDDEACPFNPRSSGISLMQELCAAFPEQVVPALLKAC